MTIGPISFNFEELKIFTSLIKTNNYDEDKLLEYYTNHPHYPIVRKTHISFPSSKNDESNKSLMRLYDNFMAKKTSKERIKLNIEKHKKLIKKYKLAINLNPKNEYSLDLKQVVFDNKNTLDDSHNKLWIVYNTEIIQSLKIAVEKMNRKSKLKIREKKDAIEKQLKESFIKEKEHQENIKFEKSKEKIEKYCDDAKLFLEKEKYPEAIFSFTRAILLDEFKKSDLDIIFERGLTKMKVSDYLGSINDINESIKAKGDCINKRYYMGLANYKLENYIEAISEFTLVLKGNSRNEKAYFFRGLCQIGLKNKSEGCIDLSKSGELGYFVAYEEIKKHCI